MSLDLHSLETAQYMTTLQRIANSFYQLDDEARKEVVETIQFKLQYHKDPERAEQIKEIKGW